MKKSITVLVVIIFFLIILTGCSSTKEAKFIIEYVGYEPEVGELLKMNMIKKPQNLNKDSMN